MIEFRPLQNVSLLQLADTFNRAFTGYFVPIQMTEALLREKMQAEQSNLAYSAGAFYDSQLIGMLLQGVGLYNGVQCAYNGGTGVFSEFRGQQITRRMYAFLEPLLKEAGVKKCLLEVIVENEAAIKAYQSSGFQIKRTFDCFRGTVKPLSRKGPKSLHLVVAPALFPWQSVTSFNNFLPSWPYTLDAAQRIFNRLSPVVAYLDEQCVGFGLINPHTGRIFQFGVHSNFRSQGIGYEIFHKMAQLTNRGLSILNIDCTDQATIQFLLNIGFEKYIGQYEMERNLF